jgi:hypothetical protein
MISGIAANLNLRSRDLKPAPIAISSKKRRRFGKAYLRITGSSMATSVWE